MIETCDDVDVDVVDAKANVDKGNGYSDDLLIMPYIDTSIIIHNNTQ
jgi:hypothetical protein